MISVNNRKVKQIFTFYPPQLLIIVNNNHLNSLKAGIYRFFEAKSRLTLANIYIMPITPQRPPPPDKETLRQIPHKDFLVYY